MCCVEAKAGRGLVRGIFKLTFFNALLTPCERLEHRGEPKEGKKAAPDFRTQSGLITRVLFLLLFVVMLRLDLSHVTVWVILSWQADTTLPNECCGPKAGVQARRGM